MSEGTVIVVCATISAIVSIFTAWVSHRTHKAVNSRMTDFLDTAEKKFRALGELEGAAREKREEQERRLNPPLQDMRGD